MKRKVIIRTLGLIIGGILVCIVVPVLFRFLIFNPFVSLFSENEDLIKSIVAPFTTLMIIISYYYFYKFFEKREIVELNIRQLPKSFVLGSSLGFGIISMVVLTLFLSGDYSIVKLNSLSVLFKPLMLFAVMGIFEEIIFRGIIFRIVENVLGTIYALIIASLLFGFVHFTNSGFNVISGLAIALELGLLTGIVFSLTKNIWYPVFLHVGWNFAFVFYGITVSGADELSTFIESALSGPAIFTGGEFGPENSIITILFSLLVFAVLFHRNKKIVNDRL